MGWRTAAKASIAISPRIVLSYLFLYSFREYMYESTTHLTNDDSEEFIL